MNPKIFDIHTGQLTTSPFNLMLCYNSSFLLLLYNYINNIFINLFTFVLFNCSLSSL